jgi:MFS transporter, DHA1 family, tetracycline resistance protein
MTESSQTDGAAPGRRAGVRFIFVTVFLDTMSFGVLIPVLPLLISKLAGGDAAHQAFTYGAFTFVWAVMQFFASPVLGALSDRYGRRPIILFSNFGVGLQYVLFALAPNLAVMFAARIFSGIASASAATASAYIADVTAPEKRAAAFGVMGAAFGGGFILGPAFGGWLSTYDPHLPLWIAAGMCTLSGLYGLFVLPESLPPERRRAFDWRRANPLGAFRFLQARPDLFGLATMKFLADLSHMVFPAVFVLFAAYRFKWDSQAIGAMMAVSGTAGVLVQAGLVGRVVRAVGERRALIGGLSFGVLGLSIYGAAWAPQMLFLAIGVFAFWGFATPAAQSLMTRRVSATEQGALQGAIAGLASLAGMIGPVVYTGIFGYFVSDAAPVIAPGAPFFLAASFLALALVVAVMATGPSPRVTSRALVD